MGFTIFGIRFFDFTKSVSYTDAFFTIIVVCAISLMLFFIAKLYKIKG